MKVKAVKDYYDLTLNKTVKAGEEYEVTADRARELSGSDNRAKQQLVEVIEDPAPTPAKVAKPRTDKKKTEV